MQNNYDQQDADLLTNIDVHLVRASTGKRFANYLIDLATFYLFIIAASFTLAFFNPEAIQNFGASRSNALLENMLSLLLYGIYMFAVEAIFRGKSLGKLITGTRAVNLDGSKISTTTAMGRGLSRAVPFDGLSALGSPSNPWHDSWNKSMVIDEKLSTTSVVV